MAAHPAAAQTEPAQSHPALALTEIGRYCKQVGQLAGVAESHDLQRGGIWAQRVDPLYVYCPCPAAVSQAVAPTCWVK